MTERLKGHPYREGKPAVIVDGTLETPAPVVWWRYKTTCPRCGGESSPPFDGKASEADRLLQIRCVCQSTYYVRHRSDTPWWRRMGLGSDLCEEPTP